MKLPFYLINEQRPIQVWRARLRFDACFLDSCYIHGNGPGAAARLCNLCNIHPPESVSHVLLDCNHYDFFRSTLCLALSSINRSSIILPADLSLASILNPTTRRLMEATAHFIIDIHRLRKF
jgi:hypothetical protein